MQLAILNLLLGIPNGALGNGNGTSDGALPDLFSQLLNDAGSDAQQQAAGGQLLGDVSSSALVAQEVADSGKNDQANVNDVLNQEISAADASVLLEKFQALSAQGNADDHALLAQLKDALTHIKQSGTPQKVGALLAQLPALQRAEHNQVAARVMGWMKDNLADTSQEQSPQDVATDTDDESASPVAQSLQASMFRDDDDREAKKEETRDYVEIVPLSAQVEAPAWVKNLARTPVRADLDQAIPPLSSAQNNDELPEVNLPSMGKEEGKAAIALGEKLRPLSEHITDQNAVQSAVADPTTVAAPVAAHVGGTGDHRGNVISIANAHGPINHAPVAEQVHVAVARGKQDGLDQLTIQLDPADLGRVEVRMHTASDGQTQLSFLVDKPETLDSLSRDARSLERSLQEAGVKADAGSMQFNLRQQPQPNQTQGDGQYSQRNPQWDEEEGSAPQAAAAISAATKNYTLTLHDGVDIRA